MRNPRPVVSITGLALLVCLHLGDCFLVGYRVGLDGDKRRHAAHGVHVAFVTRLDGKL